MWKLNTMKLSLLAAILATTLSNHGVSAFAPKHTITRLSRHHLPSALQVIESNDPTYREPNTRTILTALTSGITRKLRNEVGLVAGVAVALCLWNGLTVNEPLTTMQSFASLSPAILGVALVARNANDRPEPITQSEVKGLFRLWNDALASGDADNVAARYSKNAVLLPTVSDLPRTNYDLIRDYFVNFCQKKPQGKILQSNVIVGHNWAQDAGIYEFTMGTTGDKVKARYSFVYVFEDGEWKISHHHSSTMPESST